MPHYEVAGVALTHFLLQLHADSEEEAIEIFKEGAKEGGSGFNFERLTICDSETRAKVLSVEQTEGSSWYLGEPMPGRDWLGFTREEADEQQQS